MNLHLAFGVDEAGHLVAVPSGARRQLTTLGFLADGLTVSMPSCAPVTLGWDLYGHVASAMDGPARPDGWIVAPWTMGRRGPIGVAVHVSGTFERATARVHAATSTMWRRFNAAFGSTLNGRALPVLTNNTAFDAAFREYSLLLALCVVLHDMPELRSRLDEAPRVRRLAKALDARRLKLHPQESGLSGDAVDIHVALAKLGYTHRYTRPLRSSDIPSAADVTDRVMTALANNPYRFDRPINRDKVERVVRRDFVEVEPWPFEALIDP